jgi:hypothetical protein
MKNVEVHKRKKNYRLEMMSQELEKRGLRAKEGSEEDFRLDTKFSSRYESVGS